MNHQVKAMKNGGGKKPWQQDFMASIVVFLVSLPLSMGIAIASGAPASTGLIGGVVGGLVVGALSGCPLQVSGPAAGLATIMFDAIQRHGMEQLGLVVFLAGLIQMCGGWLKVGQWFQAVSPAVVRGMLGGIGVLIFASQFHVMLDDAPRASGLQNLMAIPGAIQKSAHVPHVEDRDVRVEMSGVLQELGQLHHDQLRLKEQITLRIPKHRPAADESTPVHLEAFIPEQRKVQDRLNSILARCRELFENQPEKIRRIEKYGATALAAQETSLADLNRQQWSLVLASQNDAAARLFQLQDVFKNHELAAGIGLLTIVSLLIWPRLPKGPWTIIPAPLVAVLLALGASACWQLPVVYVEMPDSMLDEMTFLPLSSFRSIDWAGIVSTAVIIAILASAQSLLTATAVDQMHHGPRGDYDKELFAQGVGNSLCGLVGALPLASVIVRSTTNIEAGGQTRLSTMLHGLWMLLSVVLLAGFLRMVPTSALAAVLVYTGFKLVDWKAIRQFWEYGIGELVVYLATMIIVVAVDLMAGVTTGFVLALILLAYRFSRLKVRLEGPDGNSQWTVRLEGAGTFLKLPRLTSALAGLPGGSTVTFNTQRLHYIDQACLQCLQCWTSQHEAAGGKVLANWELLQKWAQQRYSPSSDPFPATASPAEVVSLVER